LNLKQARFYLLLLVTLTSAPSSYAATAFITNQGEHTVSVLDTSTNRVIKTIPVGRAPVGVATSNERVYISNVDSQNLFVIDAKSQAVVQTVAFPGSPVGMVASPDGKTLYIADWTDDLIYLLNTSTLTIEAKIEVGKAQRAWWLVPMAKSYISHVVIATMWQSLTRSA